MTRLSAATLAGLPASVHRPAYDRSALKPGIVHLGLGAFARGHLAEYTEDALEKRFGAWGIVGASLQRPDQRDRLKPQDGLYTLLKLAPTGPELRVIGSVLDVLVAPESPSALIARLAAPRPASSRSPSPRKAIATIRRPAGSRPTIPISSMTSPPPKRHAPPSASSSPA